MNPLEELRFGMKKEDVLEKVAFYRNSGILDENDIIDVYGSKVKISFRYCSGYFGYTLEGVTFKSDDNEKFYQKLKKQLRDKDYTLDIHIIMSSTSVIQPPPDTLVCLYTNKLKYSKRFLLECKKQL